VKRGKGGAKEGERGGKRGWRSKNERRWSWEPKVENQKVTKTEREFCYKTHGRGGESVKVLNGHGRGGRLVKKKKAGEEKQVRRGG